MRLITICLCLLGTGAFASSQAREDLKHARLHLRDDSATAITQSLTSATTNVAADPTTYANSTKVCNPDCLWWYNNGSEPMPHYARDCNQGCGVPRCDSYGYSPLSPSSFDPITKTCGSLCMDYNSSYDGVSYDWGPEVPYLTAPKCNSTSQYCTLSSKTAAIFTPFPLDDNITSLDGLAASLPYGFNPMVAEAWSGDKDITITKVAQGSCAYWTFIPLYQKVHGTWSGSNIMVLNNYSCPSVPNVRIPNTDVYQPVRDNVGAGSNALGYTHLVEYDCTNGNRIPSTYSPEYNKTNVRQPDFGPMHAAYIKYFNSNFTPAAHRTGTEKGLFDANTPLASDCLAAATSIYYPTWEAWTKIWVKPDMESRIETWTEPDMQNWETCTNPGGSKYPGCVIAASFGTCEIRLEWMNKNFNSGTDFHNTCADVNGGLTLNMLASTQRILDTCQQDNLVSGNMELFSDKDKDGCQSRVYVAKAAH